MNEVTDNTAQQRFEIQVEGLTCFIDYRRQGDVINMTYAKVPTELEGRGFGAALTKGALDIVRSRNQTVVPLCSFVAAYIRRHPEYHWLLA